MKFQREDWTIDLGETPVENMFLNSYMLMASGDAVKAYLLGYKCAYDKSEIPEEDLCSVLQIPQDELDAIWDYWVSLGLIERKEDRILFRSLRQMYLGVEAPDYYAQPQELVKEAKDEETAMMIEQIESILTVSLRPNQAAQLLSTLGEYPMDKEVGVMSFSYAFNDLKTRDFDYALGVWRKWYIAGVRTMDDLEKHLSREKERNRTKEKKKQPKETSFTTKGQGQDRLTEEEMKALIERKLKKQRKGRS